MSQRSRALRILPWVVLAGAWALPAAGQQFEQTSPLSFSMVQGGASPLPQVLPVASTSNSSFYCSANISTSSGGSWLSLASNNVDAPGSFVVSINNNVAATLAPGSYSGQVVINASSSTETVPVTLTVIPAGVSSFANLPGGLSYSLALNGGAGSQVIQVNNAGSGTLNWTVSANTFNNANFLTVSAASGTAPSLVTVGVATQNLPGGGRSAGMYVGQLVFTSAAGSVTVPVAVSVGITSFVQSAPLSFSMPVGGNAPLPQVIPGASIDNSSFDFEASAYSTNGGNWLTIVDYGTLKTPESVLVAISQNNVQSLPAGTYTGEVLVTAYSSGTAPTMVIPVTLTISPSTVPFFDNPPGGMNFYLPANGINPGSQTLQIRNAGAGTLNWTAVATTADGGNWLAVSPLGGSAPSLVTVQVQTHDLPGGGAAGIYGGNILFESAGSTISVPVTVSVGLTAFLPLTPLSAVIPFAGLPPIIQTGNISSTTGSNFDFNTEAFTATGGSWLSASSGGTSETPSFIEIDFNQRVVATLPAGAYTGEVVVSSYSSGVAEAMTIPVTLTVAPPGEPFFDDLPGGLSFALPANGASPGSQVIQVRNAGSGELNFTVTASTADGGNWLTVSPNGGTAPSLVTVGVLPQNLPGGAAAGIYNGTLLFQSANGTATVPVTVSVGSEGFVQVNPISFNMRLNGTAPLPQPVSIAGTTATALDFGVSYSTSSGGNWLALQGGTTATPYAINITVNQNVAGNLPAGAYTGEVILTPYSSGTAAPLTIPVTLTISPNDAPFFDSVPGGLQFSLQANGGNPASQIFQIRNAGAGTLNWTLVPTTADGGNWLTVSSTSGTAPSFITVGVVVANLPGGGAPGWYNGNLLIEGAGTTVTIPITVTVGEAGFAQVNPLSFTMPLGGRAPLPQELWVSSLTGTNVEVDTYVSTANGGSWLVSSPGGGTLKPPQSFTLSFNQAFTSSLPAGTYMAQITMTPYSSGATASPLTIPISLTVAPATVPFFDNLPGGLYFSSQVSGANPAAQTISVRNAGSGQLSWNAITSTSDGGNWLTISSTSGTAPSQVSISVLAQYLPGQGATAGTYTGQVLFQSANGSVTVPVTVGIGSTAFAQSNGLTFTVPPNSSSQTFTVATVGGSSPSINAYNYTGNGGNWLTISNTSGDTYTVTVNGSALGRGTYTGEVLVLPSNGSSAGQIVPITVNVSGAALASVTAVSGTPQSATVSTAFGSALVAVVKDSSGNSVPGVAVTFTAPASGASGTFAGQTTATVTTDSNGNATSPIFTANGIAGSYLVTATFAGVATPAGFSLTNTNSHTVTPAAQYVGVDTLSQGTWTGEYGGDGYSIVNGTSSLPGYATLNFTGGTAYTWTASTTDVRALQTASGASTRIASAYYAASSFAINVNLTDGNTHRVALYLLDWDSTTRTETISVLNANTQAVLSTQTFSNFHNGTYAVWNLTGNVIIQVTNNGGSNAVVAGVFFGPLPTATASATYSATDASTQGTWTGQYGADGNLIATETAAPPAYATVSLTGATSFAWAASTSDPRALQTANGASTRIASTYYAGSSFAININLTDGNAHRVALYLLDWDTSARAETISVIDANTHLLLDTESYANFHNGVYAAWNIKGDVIIEVTDTGGANPVVAGIFFDPVVSTTASATYSGMDVSTEGTWTSQYGTDGNVIAAETAAPPAYATVSFTGATAYAWAASSSDPRALQTASGASTRIASTYYGAAGFSINVNLTDGNAHRVALYLLDWDTNARAETISILDAHTHALLDTENYSSFHNGVYATWDVKGDVIIQVTGTAGANPVVAGIFFDPPVAVVSYVGADTTTEGTWTGKYGSTGEIIPNDLSNAPAFATVSVTGDTAYTWASSTSDPRALQTSSSASSRIASTYYSAGGFTIAVNLTDGNTHKISLYLLDWDSSARAQTISIIDANSHALLSTQSYSSFHNGEYAVWNVKGNVLIQVTNAGGANAVVSGLFFD